MENTPQNKVKFFSQYWGQRVFVNPILSTVAVNNIFLFNYAEPEDIEDEYLELKPLSSITDDDLKHIYTRQYNNDKIFFKDISDFLNHHDSFKFWTSEEADILRNLGFAIEWMGLSVEKQIKYGWIKLK